MTTTQFPNRGKSMMDARRAAFDGPYPRSPIVRHADVSADVHVTAEDLSGAGRVALVRRIVERVSTGQEGPGIGYCVLRGFAALMPIESTRATSLDLLRDVWDRFRELSPRIPPERPYEILQTLTHDGRIPPELFGSRWSRKPPHADSNSVLFAHVYGPYAGFDGGEAIVVDALAYAQSRSLGFDAVCAWSDDPGDKKPVLRVEHLAPALAGFGRNLGRLGPDEILFVNNGPDGVFHGASELSIHDEPRFLRVLHRCIAIEREQ